MSARFNTVEPALGDYVAADKLLAREHEIVESIRKRDEAIRAADGGAGVVEGVWDAEEEGMGDDDGSEL